MTAKTVSQRGYEVIRKRWYDQDLTYLEYLVNINICDLFSKEKVVAYATNTRKHSNEKGINTN